MKKVIAIQDIMGTKEVADLLSVSKQNVTNFRTRNKDFPEPIASLSSTVLYDKNDIIEWAQNHGRELKKHDPVILTGEAKIIAVCGRPRTGKSFITSMFVRDTFMFRNICSKAGQDFTQCRVQINIKCGIGEGFAIFHSPDDEYLDNLECSLSEQIFSNFIAEVNTYLKKKRNDGQFNDNCFIEIFSEPSLLSQHIMTQNNLDYLVITDTPGVSNQYKVVSLEKADLVLFMLSDGSEEETKRGLAAIIHEMAPLVASSKASFLFRMTEPCDGEEEYIELQKRAEDAMKDFQTCFIGLKNNIISSSLDVLHPAESTLCVPAMKAGKCNISEQLFKRAFESKLNECFQIDNSTSLKVKLTSILQKESPSSEELDLFTKNILSKIMPKQSPASYGITDFEEEHHDRVMTADNYRLLLAAQTAGQMQLKELYAIFSRFTLDEFPKIWMAPLIQFMYTSLASYIKKDVGIARSNHFFESYPPRTMFFIESILADYLFDEMQNQGKIDADTYCEVLKAHGVRSRTWSYVYLPTKYSTEDPYRKIILCHKCKLSDLPSENLTDFVRNRYTLGLQKLAEFQIWQTVLEFIEQGKGCSEIDSLAMDKVIEGFRQSSRFKRI